MTDLMVANHGSIFILTPVSDAGREWIGDHIPDEAMTWGAEGIVVEHRYIEAIISGAVADGLEVE